MSWEVKINASDEVALVDSEDVDLVIHTTWFLRCVRGTKYAVNGRHGLMHTMIMNPPNGMLVDHRDGNGLDNRRSNLRLCTPSQNQANRKKRGNHSSRFKGVRKYRLRGNWRAEIVVEGKCIFLGYFDTELEAAMAYDRAARESFGEYACLNIPRLGERSCL